MLQNGIDSDGFNTTLDGTVMISDLHLFFAHLLFQQLSELTGLFQPLDV